MLSVGDLVPHFRVTDTSGRAVEYAKRMWQRRNLLLVRLPAASTDAEAAFVAALARSAEALEARDTELLLTRDPVEGIPRAGTVVADKWGEVFAVHHADEVAGLPPALELVEWADYVQRQCPECRGEAR